MVKEGIKMKTKSKTKQYIEIEKFNYILLRELLIGIFLMATGIVNCKLLLKADSFILLLMGFICTATTFLIGYFLLFHFFITYKPKVIRYKIKNG